MLGCLIAQEGGLELLQYICRDATDHEYSANDDDWMFRQAVLQAKDILPDSFRIAVWYKWCYQQIDLFGVPVSKETIPNCRALVDDVNVRVEYCRDQQPGYECLREMDRLARPATQEVAWVGESAAQDCVPRFGIAFSIHGGKFRKDIVWELTRVNAPQCLIWLMDECKYFFRSYPVKEMLCFACANMREKMGIPVIEYLSKRFPEKVAACVDELGNNPLWYLLHNKFVAWWRPTCGMAQALVKTGCNPKAVNHIGLSFRMVVNSLTKEQRKSLREELKKTLAGN
jgi:hypothetical protein